MAGWALVEFTEASFTWGTRPLVALPDHCEAEGRSFEGVWHSSGTHHSVTFVAGGGGWCLANEQVVNRLRFSPFLPLNHGDVIEVDGVLVMLMQRGAELTWPRFPELEQLVIRDGGSASALNVLGDAVLERIGGEGLLSGAGLLRPLLARGLILEFTAGFPSAATFRGEDPRVAAWLTRWIHELATSPLFQFVRRIELRVPAAPQAEVDAQVRALAIGLSSYRLPLLQDVHLDLPLDCTDYDSLEQLRLLARSHLAPRDHRDEPAETGMLDEIDVRLFDPPAASGCLW